MGLHRRADPRGERFSVTTSTVAARIGASANAEEILVSRVLRDLVGPTREFSFVDRGEHELRGIEGAFES